MIRLSPNRSPHLNYNPFPILMQASRLQPAGKPENTTAQLKQLHNPKAPWTLTFWLDSPRKTQFSIGDRPILYYQIHFSPAATGHLENFSAAYFTLFKVSLDDKWLIILNNEPVEAGKAYSLPTAQTALQPWENVKTVQRLRPLTAGHQHFNAIVTAEPIAWETLAEADITTELQRVVFWAMASLTVEVD